MNVKRTALWVVVMIGFLAALYSAARRWQTETRNRAVEITVEMDEVRKLAQAARKPIPDVLKRLHEATKVRDRATGQMRDAGIASVAIAEETLASLEEARRIAVPPWLNRDEVSLTPQEPELTPRIVGALEHRLGITAQTVQNGNARTPTLLIQVPYHTIRGMGIGLDPVACQQVTHAGLGVVGRVSNFNGVTADGVQYTMEEQLRQGVKTVIFSGDEVLGYKGYYLPDDEKPDQPSLTSVLRDKDMWFGSVEFGKQRGDPELSKEAADRVVRVHTVLPSEMVTANVPTNVQRFNLAARERNIRLLFVRLFLDEKNPLEFNADYIAKIIQGLDKGGLEVGPAHGYAPLTTPLWVRILIGFGLAAGWLLLLDSITGLLTLGGNRAMWVFAVIIAVALAGLAALPGFTGVKIAAFAASCIFPTLALLHKDLTEPAPVNGKPFLHALLGILGASAITGLGIAFIVGLLADRVFLVKADAFIGIKGSQLVPILLVGLVYGLNLRATPGRSFAQALKETGERFRSAANEPIRLWQVTVFLVAAAVLVVLVMRTGNDPGVGVSPLELKVRALLDNLLGVRPRFKEFLIGHPALILALIYAALGNRKWAMPLVVVGAIGQASLLNAFCHLHTPLPIILWRAALGLVIGIALGPLAAAILKPKRANVGSAPTAAPSLP